MHIRFTRLLEDSVATANYDLEGKLYEKFQDLNWGDNRKIEEAMTNVKDDKDEVKDP